MKLTIVFQSLLLFSLIYLFSCTATRTETDMSMSNQINLRINMGELKGKKKPAKAKFTKVQEPPKPLSTAIRNAVPEKCPIPGEIHVGKGPIYYSGWVKYINYVKLNANSPRQFFKNKEFFEQTKLFPRANLNETSLDDGTKKLLNTYIKGPTYFYLLVFMDNINFISSRQSQLQKTYDTLSIQEIALVTEDPGYGEEPGLPNKININGIQDYGSFAEGSCMKILTSNKIWIICTDTEMEKRDLMAKLNKLKIKQQREQGIINKKAIVPDKEDTIQSLLNQDTFGQKVMLKVNKTDGYWVTLQEWSQCSLKCGGGISTFHRLCIPPRGGGKPCDGQPVLTRPCNTHKCPEVGNSTETTLKPILKTMAFSNRPQRYTKCVIKESDLMYIQNIDNPILNNPGIVKIDVRTSSKRLPIPTRVVMNNKALSVFAGEDYTSLVVSHSLETTTFSISKNDKCCFFLTEGQRTSELCPFGMICDEKELEQWDYEFNLFKNQCQTPKERLNESLEAELKKKLDMKLQAAKSSLLAERESEIKKMAAESDQSELNSIVKKTNDVALKAIQKEVDLESLIKKEEFEREQKEEEEMLKKIAAENKKSECLMQAIKERQIENQYNLRTQKTEEEILSIKKSAADEVKIRRNQLKEAITKMRSDAGRRLSRLASKLHSVKSSMASAMNKAYKKGDENKCQRGMTDGEEKKSYCEANFPEDYDLFTLCNGESKEEFCQVCCEHEYGEMHMGERQRCISSICLAPKDVKVIEARWLWHVPL